MTKASGVNALKKVYQTLKDNPYQMGLLITILTISIYMLINFNRTMPFAEGWYTYYAQLIHKGEIPYVDFEYLFMPLYMYVIALITSIAGYSIIVLRIFGALLFVGIAWMAYKIFNEISTPFASTLAAITTVLYLQSEAVQIFYDYIRVMDLFAYLSIFLMIKMTKSLVQGKNAKHLGYWIGITTACVLLIKQNVGMLLITFVFLFFILLLGYLKNKKEVLKQTSMYFAGVLSIIALLTIFLVSNGGLVTFLNQTLFGAVAAKGGAFAVLFNWIIRGIPEFWDQIYMVGILGIVIGINLGLRKIFPLADTSKSQNRYLPLFFIALSTGIVGTFFIATAARLIETTDFSFNYASYLFSVLCFLLLLALLVKDKWMKQEKGKKYLPYVCLLGSIITLGYAVGMSGGLVESQVALSLGIIILIVAGVAQHKFHWYSNGLLIAICLLISLNFVSKKYISPYSWWGMTEPVLWENTEKMDIPIFAGLRVSKKTKEIYEGIARLVAANTTEESKIFCYPHIPIFYTLTNREDPGTFTKVQWFDVSTDQKVTEDINVLLEDPPKAIIMYNLPYEVMRVHEAVFNSSRISGVHNMLNALEEVILPNGYVLIKTYEIDADNSISLYIREPVALYSK